MKKFEHGGNIYNALKKTGQKPVLDFSANINPLGLSLQVRRAIVSNIDNVVHYPDATACDLKENICSYYKVNEKMLVLGNGATELLYLLCHVIRPQKVFLPVPCFSEYERAALSCGAKVEYLFLSQTDGFHIDYLNLLAALPDNSLVFLGNPNNPTGKLLEKQGFSEFSESLQKKNCQLVLDESFIDFLEDSEERSLRNFCLEYENLFLIHSLTKFFAIPGLRLGFGLFPPVLAERLRGATDCWNVNNLAQAAGIAALQDCEYIKKSKFAIKQYRENFVKQLSVCQKIKLHPSCVNFLLLNIEQTGLKAEEFCEEMAENGILVRNCANYPGLDDNYVRVAVRSEEENEIFLNILKKVSESNG